MQQYDTFVGGAGSLKMRVWRRIFSFSRLPDIFFDKGSADLPVSGGM
jgi:putative NADH-flavin reductase